MIRNASEVVQVRNCFAARPFYGTFGEKINIMQRKIYLTVLTMAVLTALPCAVSCSNDDEEEELVGNWVKVSDGIDA